MAGRLPASIFERGALAARPVRLAPASPEPEALVGAADAFELEPEEQAALVERLRALGYVE